MEDLALPNRTQPVPGARLRSGIRASALAAALSLAGTAAPAAPAPFPTVTTPVQLDGHALGNPLNPNWYEVLNTIVFDGGLYHMWYVKGVYNVSLDDVAHATSTDGVHFTTQGVLTFPANWWAAYGATVEPVSNYLRVSRDGSGNWILMIWHPNGGASYGQYNYNTSLWLLGPSIANLSPTQIGPLPTLSSTPPGPGGNHVGPFGIVGSDIYLGQDTAKALGRYLLTPSTTSSPPAVSPTNMGAAEYADAYAGTGLCSFATCPGSPSSSYIHNYGRTLDQGGGVIGTYYELRDYNTFTRRAKQLWYVESTDGGATWSANAQGLFANGAAVTVDGLPNTGNFSLPEVTALGGGQYRSYFNTVDACGNYVTVTAALPGTERGLTVAKSFNPTVVAPGGSSQLTVTLTAPAATCTPAPAAPVYTGLGFTDNLPTGMTVASTPNASTSCAGATLTAAGGAALFALSGASLAPGASCTATVDVTVAGSGSFHNVISATPGQAGAVTNDQGVAALADATANLQSGTPAPVPTLGQWAFSLLALLLAGLGWRRLQPVRRSR